MPRARHIHIIVNPAAGRPEPVLRTLNDVFSPVGIEWQVDVTGQSADVASLVQRALDRGVDILAACGGDGTVSAVASALVGSDTPLAILPGGSGNVMAAEVGVPADLRTAAQILTGDFRLRQVDMGAVGERSFFLRVGVGLEAAVVTGAQRDVKDRVGSLAYALSALKAVRQSDVSRYRIEVDGETHRMEGVTCLVANSGSLGLPGLSLSPKMQIDDGLLDVLVIRSADLESVASLAASVGGAPAEGQSLSHWQAQEISVEADPPQIVQADGEEMGQTPVGIRVLEGVLSLVVPPAEAGPETVNEHD